MNMQQPPSPAAPSTTEKWTTREEEFDQTKIMSTGILQTQWGGEGEWNQIQIHIH